MKGEGSHLHQENVLRALCLHLWVLDLHSHRPPITQHSLMDLGQGSSSHRGVIKAHKQLMDLSRVEREDRAMKMTQFSERGQEDGPEPVPSMPPRQIFCSISCTPAQLLAWALCCHIWKEGDRKHMWRVCSHRCAKVP